MNFIHSMRNDKAFLRKVALIAIPIGLQSLLNNVLNFIDTLMIGTLGETAIASVGLANKVFFVLTLLIFGICSGSGILSSQFYGKRDFKNIHLVLGMSLLLAVSGALIFTLLSVCNPAFVMRIFTDKSEMMELGARYLKIVCLSYPLAAITQVYVVCLRSVNEVKVPVIISTIAIICNVILNYVLIFGHFGFPELGIEGAAVATLIARTIECVSMILVVYISKSPIATNIKEMLCFNKVFFSKFFKTVSPVIINEFMWGLGVTIYSVVYGRMLSEETAAITITQQMEQILQVVFMGLSSATAVILGNELGAGKLKEAEIHAKFLIALHFIATIGLIISFYILRMPIIRMFRLEEEVNIIINRCFLVFLAFLLFKVFNTVNVIGILRSGGDTKAAMILDISSVWLIGIPMAIIGGILLKLPIHIVYAMILTEEVYKFIFGLKRYKKRKWLKNIVEDVV